MLDRLKALRLVTAPAIWGKLPAHADFVRSEMRHGQSEGWQPWLHEHAQPQPGHIGGAVPTAFVLPPGALPFAKRRHVIGVIVASSDRVGRQHPLVVYQLAHRRWAMTHFQGQATHARDWLFWLARAVARHTAVNGIDDLNSLKRTVHALWRIHEPALQMLWRLEVESEDHAQQRCERAQAVIDHFTSPFTGIDRAARLCGVRNLPWTDWPKRLFNAHAPSAFWQQDADGGYVNAAPRLPILWRKAG